ncbi:unnamed protein product [Eruca vesicaria subsp. sativa]|uniref:HSF-type DNA-binding domain-containing protein n=1 Tax=Eruca vesicaria subsp. sativa TaxID=29727 RepID=A0ABC8J6G2_ERUVS|nr:unnamed protein product [Eruca vesicaria subsp. sativa]
MVNKIPKGLFRIFSVVYESVDDPSLDSIISWSQSNNSFVIVNLEELNHRKIFARFYSRHLPDLFSVLEYYGFERIKGAGELEFGNVNFVRGRPELLERMHSRVVAKMGNAAYQRKQAADAFQRLSI